MKLVCESAVSVSEDFLDWSLKETVVSNYTNAQDYPWEQPYGMAVTPYGDQLIGLIWYLDLDRKEGNYRDGKLSTRLAVSRDGYQWTSIGGGAPFMQPSENGWDSGRQFPSTTLVYWNDEIRIYYSGSTHGHEGGIFGKTGIGLATLPADRFAGLQQIDPEETGTLQTKLLSLSGSQLYVNGDLEPDDLQVELLDSKGAVVSGFEKSRSKLVRHDDLRYQVQWDATSELKSSGSSPVALRFYLKRGRLYSFQCIQQGEPAMVFEMEPCCISRDP